MARESFAIGGVRIRAGTVRALELPITRLVTGADVDLYVPHQANARIVRAAAGRLDIPEDRVVFDMAERANTSAASIPIATSRMLDEGEIPHGGLALQIGFGAGLVYAAHVIVLP